MISKYNLIDMLKAYNENTVIIDAYLKGESIEGFKDDNVDDTNAVKAATGIMGLAIGTFLILLFLVLALFIYALMILIKNWNVLEDWAKIIGVLGLLSSATIVGPVVTIVVVNVGKKKSS